MKIHRLFLNLLLVCSLLTAAYGQTSRTESFEQIEILNPNNKKILVTVIFNNDSVQIINKKDGVVMKTFKYAEIKSAEYSYTRSPRWREGLGLTAAGFLFPPLWLVALPMGFSKTQHHWLTFQTENDYAVLKINKRVKKLFIPSFETHTKVKIEAMGDQK